MNRKIELTATCESIIFTNSSSEFAEMIVTLPANGDGPPTHRHVSQTEYFETVEGKLGLDCGDKKMVLGPGQSFTVPANTLHRCYAIDGAQIKFKAVFTPALSIRYLLTEMFDASNRRNSKDPSAFEACYILRQAKGEYYLGDVPTLIQQTVFPLMAVIGKLFGLVKAKPNKP